MNSLHQSFNTAIYISKKTERFSYKGGCGVATCAYTYRGV